MSRQLLKVFIVTIVLATFPFSIVAMLSLSRNGLSFGARALHQTTRYSMRRNFSSAANHTEVYSLAKLMGKSLTLDESTAVERSHAADMPTKEMVKSLMDIYRNRGNAPREFVVELLKRSAKQHRELPNVVSVLRSREETEEGSTAMVGCVNVVGDTHGQYQDFCSIFDDRVAGFPSNNNRFVFNGDLVDRGPASVEIVLVTLLTKLLHPEVVTVLRGNHETTVMNKNYGFEMEVMNKYDSEILHLFREVFDALPIGAVIEDTVFVTHGGLGPLTKEMTIAQINEIDRFKEPGRGGTIEELLWSDPKDEVTGYVRNRGRGVAYYFGREVTAEFLIRNNLQLLIRSHEVFMDGFKVFHDGLCLSVFSAPNYCGMVGNSAAVVRFENPEDMRPVIVRYNAVTRKPRAKEGGSAGRGSSSQRRSISTASEALQGLRDQGFDQ